MKTQNLMVGIPLILLSALSNQPLHLEAQSLWSQPFYRKTVGFESAKPFFENSELSSLSSSSILSVSWPVGDRICFVGEIPIAHASWDSGFERDSQLTLGNPYLGLSLGREGADIFGQVGIRLPLATSGKDDARGLGLFADYVDRQGAFWPDMVPLTGTATYRKKQASGFLFLGTGGAEAWFISDTRGKEAELFGLYGARAGYDGPRLTVLGGIAGRTLLTEEWIHGDRTDHEAGLEVVYRASSVQPRLFVRVPLDKDIREYLDAVVGAGIRIVVE